ncbi:MAG TPA: sugar phosphate isomerase/epimerase [Acidimicrobiales bacterium]
MHPRLSVDQLCFPGAPIDEFVDHCRALGVHDVVLTSPQLLVDGGAEAVITALRDGPRVEAVNHPFAIHPDLESDEGGAGENLARVIDVAAELGARSVYVVTGGRGGLDWPSAAARFGALIAPWVERADRHGLALMVENSNGLYADIHIAHTLADTAALAEASGMGVCVELQFCWVESDVDEVIRRALPGVGLVQVSDYVLGDRSLPGRAVPGDGAIPLERLVGDLLELGYEGLFDIELLGPRIDAEGHRAAVARAAERMDAILTSLGA